MGRTFETLRVSLLNTCNLECTYCVNDGVVGNKSPQINTLEYNELFEIIKRIHSILNLNTIRLTGGEPTLYKNIVPLINLLNTLEVEIKLTTNGFLLKNLIQKLNQNDISSINVSLDAIDEDVFFQISKRRSVVKIIEGIDVAIDKGIKVKLNCVVIKGVNENQILPILNFAKERKIVIRFLEVMKMGHLFYETDTRLFSQNEILNTIQTQINFTHLPRKSSDTSNYWQTNDGQIFGIIANESAPFCSDCNRLRLDSYGNIYGCLSNPNGISIRNSVNDTNELIANLEKALLQKQTLKFQGSSLEMIEVGG
ncbi:MAG: GTP 3',8-cyclase MoaA [Bacteroidota bacterium]|nr:GTP 3',8-cyclase MoaA [Bacteroidota bacterium]